MEVVAVTFRVHRKRDGFIASQGSGHSAGPLPC